MAAWGRSRPAPRPRDESYQRGYPSPRGRARPLGKGHMAPRAAGGTFRPNLFPQDRSLNRGWSTEGRRYHALEREITKTPGTFFFCCLLLRRRHRLPSRGQGFGGLWPSAGDVDAAHPAVGVGTKPLELHEAPDPCAVDLDVRLDVRGRLPDGGNIHAEELGAALQRRGDRPGSSCHHRAIHVRFREHAPSSRPMPGRKAPAPADVLQVLVTSGPARPRSRGGPTSTAGTRPSPGRRSRSDPSPPG